MLTHRKYTYVVKGILPSREGNRGGEQGEGGVDGGGNQK